MKNSTLSVSGRERLEPTQNHTLESAVVMWLWEAGTTALVSCFLAVYWDLHTFAGIQFPSCKMGMIIIESVSLGSCEIAEFCMWSVKVPDIQKNTSQMLVFYYYLKLGTQIRKTYLSWDLKDKKDLASWRWAGESDLGRGNSWYKTQLGPFKGRDWGEVSDHVWPCEPDEGFKF